MLIKCLRCGTFVMHLRKLSTESEEIQDKALIPSEDGYCCNCLENILGIQDNSKGMDDMDKL